MIDSVKKTIDKLSKRKDIVPLIFSIILTIVFLISYHFWGNYVAAGMSIALLTIWMILILLIMLLAGFTVLKSLFIYAGELSLLFFLAQTFCSTTQRLAVNNAAMKNLFIIGLLYITFLFLRSLCKSLKESYKKTEKERWSITKVFVIAIFLTFIIWFLWEIYLVIGPIINGLCIYG